MIEIVKNGSVIATVTEADFSSIIDYAAAYNDLVEDEDDRLFDLINSIQRG